MRKIILYYLRNFPLDYGKNRIAKWVKLDKIESPVRYLNQQGVKFSLDLKEYQMKQIFLFDIYEKNTIRHLLAQIEKISKRDLTIFDVGANIGFYTLTLAKALEKTKTQIYSFEPNPFTYSVFTKNIALNNFNNILPNRLGLSDKVESLTLTFNHNNLGAANVFSGTGNKTEQIELTTLDLYCEQHKIDKIDLIKVDIEGSELNFLKGGMNVISRSEKMILIMEIVDENCQKAGYTSADLFNFMSAHGFQGYLPKGWPFGLKKIDQTVKNYHDNIIFLKGY